MRPTAILAVVLTLACAASRAADAKEMKTDDEGFVHHWLILAPIPLADGQSGAEGLDKPQVKDEAKLKPKEGDEVKIGDSKLKWTKFEAGEHYIDFNAYLGGTTEDSVAYAVCYVVADKPHQRVKLKIGSDDQSKVYLNGKEVIKSVENRGLEKDQDTSGPVDLKQGVNVIVFKVVNEKADFSGCLRLVDETEKPLAGLKVALKP
ncbi:MAG TPA: hypothetical protein VH120_06810 [Gemmataceae bacterium]|jgi:hypothetical protein|nr:hypothetical protein [Gemmataceae bacterium]